VEKVKGANMVIVDICRTHLKNNLTLEWFHCRPAQTPHHLPCMPRFFAALRLVFERDPYF
jgi:hypothetical protein